MTEVTTADLIKLIGTPFTSDNSQARSDKYSEQVYEKAFYERVAPLYLHKFKYEGWSSELEGRFQFVQKREKMTLKVLEDLSANLNEWDKNGYVIFKSIKPYPAIPNDTDLLIFGGKKEFNSTLEHLYKLGYVFHEWAPMQTTLYDPRGKGKIGAGKKGGTYYIDVYQEISTDYVCYLSEKAIKPLVEVREINSVPVKILRPEPELAVILFHNVFPERTFQLEHFYMPLYYLSDPKFDINLFARFTERNRMTYAVKTNLSFVEQLHQSFFGFVPEVLEILLDGWGRNYREVKRFMDAGL
ncbi:MAG TPA: hypothetical protein VMW42_10380, partial [Desulfatiglandales bacterium]|nr:hypothetical protein [Desulfatiglandales bacterium]